MAAAQRAAATNGPDPDPGPDPGTGAGFCQSTVVYGDAGWFSLLDTTTATATTTAKSEIFEAKSRIFEAKRTKPNPRTRKSKNKH